LQYKVQCVNKKKLGACDAALVPRELLCSHAFNPAFISLPSGCAIQEACQLLLCSQARLGGRREIATPMRTYPRPRPIGGPIADVEADGKGVPILIRQYAKLGGRLLSFNVDREFSDVLDGLVVVDLRQSDPAALERYMGKEGICRFQRYHGLSCMAARDHEA
jgi:hypothetical protein